MYGPDGHKPGTFAANALLLYGAVGYIADGSRLPLLVVAGLTTLVAIFVLSTPAR